MIKNLIAACKPRILQSLAILQALGSLVLLLERFWTARVFFKSGLTKIDDWNNTLYLFTHEYSVPLLPPAFAAASAAMIELTAPIFLVVGLASRLATLPMLVMTAVIQFTYESHPDHAVWAMLLATILCFGPGEVSVDRWLRRRFLGG
jgi:putative oxidoreductase